MHLEGEQPLPAPEESEDIPGAVKQPSEAEIADIPLQPIIEELPTEVIVQHTRNEEGEPMKKTIKKRVISKKQGDKEQNIEVLTIEEEGKEPETQVTIQEITDDDRKPSTTPKKKKVVKKIKNDDLDYIQKLIDMDIPKTELEVFEKTEFELSPKKPKEKKKLKPKQISEEKHEVQKEEVLPEIVEVEQPSEVQSEPDEKVIEEMPVETVENEVVNEDGKTVKQVVKKKVIKKRQGPREEIIEVQTIEEEGKEPETVITVEQVVPREDRPEEVPEESLKPKKKKITRNIRTTDEDDYIQRLIDADIPKTELEAFEKPEFGLIPKKPKQSKKTTKKVIETPEEQPQQQQEIVLGKEIDIEPEVPAEVEVPNEPAKKTIKKRVTPEIDEQRRIEDVTVDDEGKEPITEEKIQPEQPVIIEETTPKKKKFVKKVGKDDKDDYIQGLIDMELPNTVLERYEKPEFEPRQKKGILDEIPQVEEQSSEVTQRQVTNDDGEMVKQVVKKKVLRKRQGSREELIQITTVEEEGKEPEVVVIVEDVQTEEISDINQPIEEQKPKAKKKRMVKKIKHDDQDDYIRQLIEANIPKTELEVFEKPEFETTPKTRKSSLPKLRDKPRKTKSMQKEPSKNGEETVVEESLEPQIADVEIRVEEHPIEIVEVEVPKEDGETVKQVIKKRIIKKQQGPRQEIIEVTTVEEDGKEPEIQITVQEIAPNNVEEEKAQKKKKVVRKVKTADQDEYIRKLIEAEIPKTELEVYEKPEFEAIPKTKLESEQPELSVNKLDKQMTKRPKKRKEKLVGSDIAETVILDTPVIEKSDDITPIEAPEEIHHPSETSQIDEIPVEKVPEKLNVKKEKKKQPVQISDQAVLDTVTEQVTLPDVLEKELREDIQPEERIIPQESYERFAGQDQAQEVESDEFTEEIAEPETVESQPKELKTTVKLKKKKPKKPVTAEEDEYIKHLLEQDIPKTELQKYEKFEIEKTKKPKKAEYAHLVPITIERKEQKPIKVKIISAEETPQPIRLKSKIPKQLEKEVVEEKVPKFKLKSRITFVEASKPIIPKVTDMKTKRDRGELSRNIEEAEEVLKAKAKKFKHIKKRKDSLERPELEKYERYESSSDESTKGKSYQRPEKVTPQKEELEDKSLKLGRGKPKPEEESPEQVKLRPVPEKKTAEEATVVLKTPKPVKECGKPLEEEPKDKYVLKPIEGLDFEPYDVPEEEPEKFDIEKKPKKKEQPEKPIPLKKKKPKPEPETIEHPIVPGMTLNLFRVHTFHTTYV